MDEPPDKFGAKSTYVEKLGSARLRQIIRRGDRIDLQMVACACPPGTEETQQCNNGWPCARLTVDGKDVGAVLVAENLAHTFVCGQYSCPKRMSWCPLEPRSSVRSSLDERQTVR